MHQGIRDKLATIEALAARHGLALRELCYIGDDVGDVPALRQVGLAVAVADAMPAVLEAAHYTTHRRGGDGAVREVCDLILAERCGPGA